MNFTLLAAAQQGSMWPTILMMVALFAIRYFFCDALAVGQDVVTIGGIHGTIKNIDGTIITLKVATGVEIRVEKAAINPNGTQPAQA